MAKAPPSFDFYLNDWHGGTKHLTMLDRACYLELLLYQWANGEIPRDPEMRMHLCQMTPDAWKAIWDRIKDKFEPREVIDEDGHTKTVLVNPRMANDREAAIAVWLPRKELSEKRRIAGKKGGLARIEAKSKQTSSKVQANAQAKRKQIQAKLEEGRGKAEDGRDNFLEEIVSSPAYNPMDDQTVTEAEFIELWNATEGVVKIRNQTFLGEIRRRKLAARLQEPNWWPDFQSCLAKFPLPGWFEGQKNMSADAILEAGKVDRVLEGEWDHSKAKPKANNSYFD